MAGLRYHGIWDAQSRFAQTISKGLVPVNEMGTGP